MRVRSSFAACLLALIFVVPVHAGELLWTRSFKKDVAYKTLTAAGVYLVMTEERLYGISPVSGNELWTLADQALTQDDIEYVEGSPLLLIAKGKGFVQRAVRMSAISIIDGTEIWKARSIPGVIVGSRLVYNHGLVLLFSVGGGDGVAIDAYDMFDGTHRYRVAFPENREMKTVHLVKPPEAGPFSMRLKLLGHQEPIVDGDHLIMFYDYLRRIDLTSGAQVWMDEDENRPAPGDAPMPGKGYAQMALHDGVLYTPYGRGLAAFDAATGRIVWRVEQVGGDIATGMVFAGDRLYYRGGGITEGAGIKAVFVRPVFGAVSRADGSPVWPEEFRMNRRSTPLVLKGDKAYAADAEQLIILNTADGTRINEKEGFRLGFSGAPYMLTDRKDGLLVQGFNDVTLLDINGDAPVEVWHRYYKAPEQIGFEEQAVSAVLSLAAGRSVNTYNRTPGNRRWRRSRSKAWTDFNQVMSVRSNAVRSSDRYHYILTRVDGGYGLKGINLRTGQADRTVLFKEKRPDYQIDETGGVVFFLKKQRLQAFRLEG